MKTLFTFLLGVLLPLSSLLAQNNQKVGALINEGIRLHDRRLYAAAIDHYKQALKIDKNSSGALYEMAYTYLTMQEYKKSIKFATKVIKLDQEYVDQAYMLKANALDDLGKYSKAQAVYQEGIKHYPENQLFYFNYGLSLYRSKKLEEAEFAILQGIQVNPAHASSHYLLGLLMAEKGQQTQAVMALYYFLLIEPEGERAKNAYRALQKSLYGNTTTTEDGNINLLLNPANLEGPFSSSNMIISLLGATNKKLREAVELSEAEIFANNMETIFKMVNETEIEKPNGAEVIWMEFYVKFYQRLLEAKNHFETANYQVLSNSGETEVEAWILENPKALLKLRNFIP